MGWHISIIAHAQNSILYSTNYLHSNIFTHVCVVVKILPFGNGWLLESNSCQYCLLTVIATIPATDLIDCPNVVVVLVKLKQDWNLVNCLKTYCQLTSVWLYCIEWRSEWLSFNANSAIFQLYQRPEQLNFQWEDDGVRFVLDQHAQLGFYSASSLKQVRG